MHFPSVVVLSTFGALMSCKDVLWEVFLLKSTLEHLKCNENNLLLEIVQKDGDSHLSGGQPPPFS
jgi:hypothetical protein